MKVKKEEKNNKIQALDAKNIDILEQNINEISPSLLKILLKDKTTGKYIYWACDEYIKYGKAYTASKEILPKLIINKRTRVIQPRITKIKTDQQNRTKKSAEVFTPSWICNEMINHCDEQWFGKPDVFNIQNDHDWMPTKEKIQFKEYENNKKAAWMYYVDTKRLEITCGEGPYLTSRYDTTTGDFLPIEKRIGILDRKLRIVNENTNNEEEWFKWARRAYEATYGYEYQGDNLLLARENLLFTFIDNFKFKHKKEPTIRQIKQIANIIAWNIWQMDGLTNGVPNITKKNKGEQLELFEILPKKNLEPIFCKIKNWRSNRVYNFKNFKGGNMKFDVVIGNPPYQGNNHQQLYPFFYISAINIAKCVIMIFPTGWQAPKDANNLRLLNKPNIKEDCQIVFIHNKYNVFKNIMGAQWTNIIMWINGYNNNLNGKQLIITENRSIVHKHLNYNTSQIEKPNEIIILAKIIKSFNNFLSISSITSARKPYGLSTDVIKNTEKYKLGTIFNKQINKDDIKIYCKNAVIRYIPQNYKIPRLTKAFKKYKVFVAYAWGGMNEKAGLGGSYSDIIIACPNEICTETYLETGCFDDFSTAKKHAKYLMTKFLRALLYLNKFSQHSTTSWEAIPIQTYTEWWWSLSIEEIDNYLMDKYNIPYDIREFVFKNIQTRNEKNIINYEE